MSRPVGRRRHAPAGALLASSPRQWSDRDEVRRGAEAALAVAAALEELAGHVEERFRPVLHGWARPYGDLAELYAELDHDLERLDVDDDEQLRRLEEAVMPLLFGPDLARATLVVVLDGLTRP